MKPVHKWQPLRIKPYDIADDDPNWLRYKQYAESLGNEITPTTKADWFKIVNGISGSLGMRVTDSY